MDRYLTEMSCPMTSFIALHYPNVLRTERLVHEAVYQWIRGSRHKHQVIENQMSPSRQQNAREVKRRNYAHRNP